MSVDHDAGKRRQLETASSSDAVETDEQLARRLHEELNALTRHARRAAVPAPGPKQQPQRSKSDKLPDSKHSKSGSKQPRMPIDADGHYESDEQGDKGDKPARKRSLLNRELAMLVTDMVDSQLKTATGPRQTKSKDEQVVDQHKGSELQQQLHSVEQLLPILKHESSSSQSEQERLAMEHVQAAVADGTPQAKQAQQQHFMPRVSDSGADAAADSACISGAESSGRDSSSSSGEPDHGQQHTSPAPSDQRRQQAQHDREQQRSSKQQPAAGHGKAKQPAQQQEGGAPAKVIKIPKLPMVEYAKKWYRAKVLKDAGAKVLLEYQGYSHEGGPFWLAKDHPRIWRGSYKGKDWKYLGDGAWEPKGGKFDGKGRRVKPHRSAAAAAAPAAGEGAAAADSDTEQLASRAQRRQAQQQKHKQQQPHRRAAAAAAAAAAAGSMKQEGEGRVVEAAVSERDTTSADQQGQAGNDGDAAGAGLGPEQGEVESGMQLDEPCKQEQPLERVCGPDLVGDTVGMDVDQQQHEADVEREDRAGAVLRQQKAEEHPAELQRSGSTGQCNDSAAGMEALEAAAAAAAITAAEAKPEAAPAVAAAAAAEETAVASAAEQPAGHKDAGAAPAPVPVPVPAAPAAAAAPVPAAAGKAGSARSKSSGALLLGHTHEEMVAAAAAAVAVAAPPAPRGRATRSGRSNSARSNGEGGANEGTSNKRGGRGGRGGRSSAAAQAAAAAAAAASEQQAKQEEQPQQQAGQQQPAASGSASGSGQAAPGGLRVEPGRALKHSGSSEGPLSPTSPSGGSPRVHRRKGVPRRARLDSEDLQRPTKKARGAPKPSAYCDTAMEWQQHEQQVQMQHMMEQRRQQAQLAAQQQAAAWKAAAKNNCASSAKKSIWSSQLGAGGAGDLVVGGRDARQSSCWQQEPQQQQCWPQPSPRQQTLAAAAAAAAAAECQATIEEQQQQQLMLLGQAKLPHQGSDPEDVEAACVLLGAARAHSGEVLGVATAQGFNLQLAQRSFSTSAADEMQLSPRFAGARQAGGKRRGHNWSKPTGNTSRPPRPPAAAAAAAGQAGTSAGFRQSLTGSLPQQPQLQLQQRRVSFSNAELTGALGHDQEQHSYGALGSAALSAAAASASALGDAAAALLGRQGSLPSPGATGAAGSKPRNGSCVVGVGSDSGKQDTLRTLLDAVGQVQSASGRPDLMYPLQFGGVPMGTQLPGKDGKNGVLQPLQLLHTPVSAAAATLLAAVPSLDAVQRMAVLQGQGGVLACLTGQSPSLFL